MTKIEWCHAPGFKAESWNPIVGCNIVSPGCTNCYAMDQAAHIERMSRGNSHYAGTTRQVNGKTVWTGKVAMAEHKLDEPLRWNKRRFVFTNSMSDLFYEAFEVAGIARIVAVMMLAHAWRGHVFVVLTKRGARMREVLSDPEFWMLVDLFISETQIEQCDPDNRRKGDLRSLRVSAEEAMGEGGYLPGIIWGVSVEDQTRADERIPDLLATPAWQRCISAEPLLGEINLERIRAERLTREECGGEDFCGGQLYMSALCNNARECAGQCDSEGGGGASIDWVFGGLESGDRPGRLEWALNLQAQCASNGVAFLWKQNGSFLEGVATQADTDGTPFSWAFADGTYFDVNDERSHTIARDALAHSGGVRHILNEWWASGDGRLLKKPASKSLSGNALPVGWKGGEALFDVPKFESCLQWPRAIVELAADAEGGQ
ncbi:DUF5131 family protein [Pyruvatibacter sp.]